MSGPAKRAVAVAVGFLCYALIAGVSSASRGQDGTIQITLLQVIPISVNMLTQLVVISLMGLCHADDQSTTEVSTLTRKPDQLETSKQDRIVEYTKQNIKFLNEHTYERWWATEERTCQEVKTVLDVLKENIKTDLNLLMEDARKHLNNVRLPGNKRRRRCSEDIEEEIQEAVISGVEKFSKCTATSATIQDQIMNDMQKRRSEYEKIVGYILSNIDTCLEYKNVKSEVHWEQCIQKLNNENLKQISAVCKTFSESKCMTIFKDEILSCSSEVFYEIINKRKELMKEINECVGYASVTPVEENFGLLSKNVLNKYEDSYKLLNYKYDYIIKETLETFTNLQLLQEENLRLNKQEIFIDRLHPYFNALNKSREDNRSIKERSCYFEAVDSLNAEIQEATKDYKECDNNNVQQRVKSFERFANISNEFNKKLKEAGNVALLKCIAQRPQEIFNSITLDKCALLENTSIQWEMKKASIEIGNVLTSLVPIEILHNGKACGKLIDDKLILRADQVLERCERCLYGLTGDHYAVTLAPLYTMPSRHDYLPESYDEYTTHDYKLDSYDEYTTENQYYSDFTNIFK